MSQRICELDGCAKPHLARGLCRMHWKREYGKTTKYTISCLGCGTAYASTRPDGKYCSEICRDFKRWGPRASPWPRKAPRLPKPKSVPFIEERECLWCAAPITATRSDHLYCTRRHKNKAKTARRRAQAYGAGGTYTWAEVTRIWVSIDKCCAYCLERKRNDEIEPDHVEPLSKGGSNSITNVVPSCKPCNSDKRDLRLDAWYVDRERRGLKPHRIDPRLHPVPSLPKAA